MLKIYAIMWISMWISVDNSMISVDKYKKFRQKILRKKVINHAKI